MDSSTFSPWSFFAENQNWARFGYLVILPKNCGLMPAALCHVRWPVKGYWITMNWSAFTGSNILPAEELMVITITAQTTILTMFLMLISTMGISFSEQNFYHSHVRTRAIQPPHYFFLIFLRIFSSSVSSLMISISVLTPSVSPRTWASLTFNIRFFLRNEGNNGLPIIHGKKT